MKRYAPGLRPKREETEEPTANAAAVRAALEAEDERLARAMDVAVAWNESEFRWRAEEARRWFPNHAGRY